MLFFYSLFPLLDLIMLQGWCYQVAVMLLPHGPYILSLSSTVTQMSNDLHRSSQEAGFDAIAITATLARRQLTAVGLVGQKRVQIPEPTTDMDPGPVPLSVGPTEASPPCPTHYLLGRVGVVLHPLHRHHAVL